MASSDPPLPLNLSLSAPSSSTFCWPKLQNGSDLRGVALDGVPGETVNLTPAVAQILGQAFGQWLSTTLHQPPNQLTIAVGRDSRLSGPSLMEGLMAGLASQGCHVMDVGMASTPALFMATILPDFACQGGIMVTASHLPFNRNGMKFFTAAGGLNKGDISDILQRAADGNFTICATPGTRSQRHLIAAYSQFLVDKIRAGVNHPHHYNTPLQGLKILVDAGNGAGGFYGTQVLQPLGADITGSQFLEPDGLFPNHVPNPEDPQAMASICGAVLAQKADFGLIFDTDVDRAAAVDAQGRELNRNRLIALLAAIVLEEHPHSTIVTDSITSDGLTRFIEQDLGGIHHRFKRGYKNVITEAQRLNDLGQECWLAMETSGHGAMAENFFLDDGAYLVSKLLVEVAKAHLTGGQVTDRLATLEEPLESREIRLKLQTPDFAAYGQGIIADLRNYGATQSGWTVVPNTHEGVRIACGDPQESGWFLLRLSLHDPVMPLNVESTVAGGVDRILDRLAPFVQPYEFLTGLPSPPPEPLP